MSTHASNLVPLRKKWLIACGFVAIVAVPLSILLGFRIAANSAADAAAFAAARRLEVGQSIAEVGEILKNVKHFNAVTNGEGQFYLYTNHEHWFVVIKANRVTKIDRVHESSFWKRAITELSHLYR